MSGLLGPLTANPQMLAQALKSREIPRKQLNGQGLLDVAASGLGPVPLVGDAMGLLADSSRFINEPQSRTPLNFGLAALGLLPIIPNMSAMKGNRSIQDIADSWKSAGVSIDAYPTKDGQISLSKIVVDKDKRGGGLGSQAMSDIVKYADETGATVRLSPSTDFGATSVNRLKDFYKRFGFVENKGQNKDFTISDSMYRPPKN